MIIVAILCQDKQKMRYVNREYVCDSSDHSSWKCVPTYRSVDGKIDKIGEGSKLPSGQKGK